MKPDEVHAHTIDRPGRQRIVRVSIVPVGIDVDLVDLLPRCSKASPHQPSDKAVQQYTRRGWQNGAGIYAMVGQVRLTVLLEDERNT